MSSESGEERLFEYSLVYDLLVTIKLIVLAVIVGLVFSNVWVGIQFVAALSAHELGHIMGIVSCGVRWTVGFKLLGICTISDAEGRSHLSHAQNALIHMAGPGMNMCLALAARVIYGWTGSYEVLLFANLNALVALINILPVGKVSDCSLYLKRVFASLDPRGDIQYFRINVVLGFLSFVGTALVFRDINLTLIVGVIAIVTWVEMLWIARADYKAYVVKWSMKWNEVLITTAFVLTILIVSGLVFVHTPFFITQSDATNVAENVIRVWYYGSSVVTMLANDPQVGVVLSSLLVYLPFLLVIMVLHELGHLSVALRFGYEVRAFCIGFPSKTGKPLLAFAVRGVRVEINRRLYAAAVDTAPVADTKMATDKLWRLALFALAGPFVNILVAVIVLSLVPCAVGAGMALISLVIGVFNLIPLPGLDGGWVTMAIIRNAAIRLSPKADPAELSQTVFHYWMYVWGSKVVSISLVSVALYFVYVLTGDVCLVALLEAALTLYICRSAFPAVVKLLRK